MFLILIKKICEIRIKSNNIIKLIYLISKIILEEANKTAPKFRMMVRISEKSANMKLRFTNTFTTIG